MQHLQPNTTLQGGKYRIERVLGQGGFGNTYVGYNTGFDERIAIKEFFLKGVTMRDDTTSVISVGIPENLQQFEEQCEKFKKEARRLRKLKNEHIVRVHDLFEENGTVYYIMDYIDGESLSERMKRTGNPLPEYEVRKILSHILDALKEVHQNEIWHLDIKPGNIMLDKEGNAYLIDFGASKQIRANGSLTTSTAMCYTPGYAPSEQIGQMYNRFGPWTDIYALGATIYSLLTNNIPPMSIDIEEDEEEAFDFPQYVSEDMRKLVLWMMQPKRKDRPQSIEEVQLRLNSSSSQKYICNKRESDNTEATVLTNLLDANQLDESTIGICTVKVGDYIYVDGSFSEIKLGKELLGVVLYVDSKSCVRIISSSNTDDMVENGNKIHWNMASYKDWVEILEKLGKTKVEIGLGRYRRIKNDVRRELRKYDINKSVYYTMDFDGNVSYDVHLDDCFFYPYPGTSITNLPTLYIAEINLNV